MTSEIKTVGDAWEEYALHGLSRPHATDAAFFETAWVLEALRTRVAYLEQEREDLIIKLNDVEEGYKDTLAGVQEQHRLRVQERDGWWRRVVERMATDIADLEYRHDLTQAEEDGAEEAVLTAGAETAGSVITRYRAALDDHTPPKGGSNDDEE